MEIGKTNLNIDEVIGKDINIALPLLKNAHINYRISVKNGETYFGTADFVHDRWNLKITDNIITHIHFG